MMDDVVGRALKMESCRVGGRVDTENRRWDGERRLDVKGSRSVRR